MRILSQPKTQPPPPFSAAVASALPLAPCDDIWRDSALRYLGYANELGEAFKPLAPALYRPSYALAAMYVLADTVDKGQRADARAQAKDWPPSRRHSHIGEQAADTLLWQTAASVAIPGVTINRLVAATKWACGGNPRLKLVPTAAGLAAIPLIVTPIDNAVDAAMDATVRPRRPDI